MWGKLFGEVLCGTSTEVLLLPAYRGMGLLDRLGAYIVNISQFFALFFAFVILHLKCFVIEVINVI